MVNKVRIGILGCANIAAKYAIKAFQSIDNAEMVAIASRNPEKAEEWASRFGLRAETSYESLINNPEIDAVYVPLPIGLHKEWIMKAAVAGKHILCEKSLSESFVSAKEAVDFCRLNKIILRENFMCDLHPQHQKILSLIGEGGIGKPFFFQGCFGSPFLDKSNFRFKKEFGGGSLNDMGAYTVFMARKMLESEPISVDCNMMLDEESGVDLKGAAILEFPDNMSASVAFSFDSVYQNNYSLWGSRGLARAERAYSIPPEMKPPLKLITNDGQKESISDIDASAANQFELIFRDFCDTALNKESKADEIGAMYDKIIAQARVLEAMRLSSKEKRRVKIEEIK